MKKNEFKNLIKKVAPVVLCLLWFGAIVLGLVLVYKDYQSKIVRSANTSMNLLCASADATDTVEETSLDVTQYPSANLLDMSAYIEDSSGVFRKNNDGTFTLTKVSDTSRFSKVCPLFLEPGKYSFSFKTVNINVGSSSSLFCVRFFGEDETTVTYHIFDFENYTSPVVFDFSCNVVSINFYFGQSFEVGGSVTFSNVMLNAGETAYPYIPPFNSIYQDGYNAGYDVGETDGKDIGYNDGYDQGYDVGYDTGKYEDKYGIFSEENYAEFGLIENGKTGVTYIDISPTFENGIADFRTVSQFCQSYYPDFGGLYRFSFVPLDNVRLRDFCFKITLLDPASFDITTESFEYMAVVNTKSSQSFRVSLVKDPLDNSLFCRIMDTDRSNIEKMGWDDTVTKIEFTFNNVNDLLFTLTDLMVHTPYEVGYDNGVISGKEIGYDEGYDVGFNEGFSQGLSDNPYGFKEMFFGILDAPFNVIRNALNFEIFGLNISSFILFILTGVIAVFVIGKIGGK